MEPLLAIDFGGTKIFAAVGTADGALLSTEEVHSDRDVDTCLANMLVACDSALENAGLGRSAVARIGIGSPSVIDHKRGIVAPHNLGWQPTPLRDLFAARFGAGADVRLENDCTAGGLGEYHFGAGQGYTRVVYFGIGTGVGGVALIDGQVVAEELGMLPVSLEGPQAPSGVTGAVEVYAGGKAIAERYLEVCGSEQEARRRLGKTGSEAISAGDIHASGDAAAIQTWKQGERALAAAVGGTANLFAPELTVIGGGVADRAGISYIDNVDAIVHEYALAERRRDLKVVAAKLGQKSVLYGALALAAGR